MGDNLRLTCAYIGRDEDVQIHWRINDFKVRPQFIVQYSLRNYVGLDMILQARDLTAGNQVSVKCIAAKTFWKDMMKKSLAVEVKPMIAFSQFLGFIVATKVWHHHLISRYI